MIEVEGLTKRYGSTLAVDELSFSVAQGTVTGFLGPNGAGKSTTLRALLGLVRPDGGRATILGRRYRDLDRPAEQVGAVLETTDAHPGRSGRNHLRVLARAARLPVSRVDEVLELVELGEAARRRVKGYSLGMRQRLGIARCLLADPRLLILDEPMNGLDPAGIQEFRGFVRSFVEEGRTIVLSSHLLDEVEKTCDEVAIVDRGRVVVQGSIAELRAGADPAVLIETRDAVSASRLLAAHPAVKRVTADGLAVHAVLADLGAVPDLNRRLVAAGHDVLRLEPEQASLEDRFLEITTRLEDAA